MQRSRLPLIIGIAVVLGVCVLCLQAEVDLEATCPVLRGASPFWRFVSGLTQRDMKPVRQCSQ